MTGDEKAEAALFLFAMVAIGTGFAGVTFAVLAIVLGVMALGWVCFAVALLLLRITGLLRGE